MNNFTRGLIIGGFIGAALGLTGIRNSSWVQKNVWRPSRRAIKKASRVMSDFAGMM